MPGFTTIFLEGLAQELAAASIGVWRPDGPPYAADETAIVIREIPAQPDRLITLSPYRAGDDYPGLIDYEQTVQVRLRGTDDPRIVDDLGDTVFDLLDCREAWTCGGILVSFSQRRSDTPLGWDANHRWEASHNYSFTVARPTAHRTQ